jgi:hypothetical protein
MGHLLYGLSRDKSLHYEKHFIMFDRERAS